MSELDSDILRDIVSKTRKRLKDADEVVVSAALTLALSLVKVCYQNVSAFSYSRVHLLSGQAKHLPTDKYHELLSELLRSTWSKGRYASRSLLLGKVVQALAQVKYVFPTASSRIAPGDGICNSPSADDLQVISEIVRHYSRAGPSAYGEYAHLITVASLSTRMLSYHPSMLPCRGCVHDRRTV